MLQLYYDELSTKIFITEGLGVRDAKILASFA